MEGWGLRSTSGLSARRCKSIPWFRGMRTRFSEVWALYKRSWRWTCDVMNANFQQPTHVVLGRFQRKRREWLAERCLLRQREENKLEKAS